MKFSATVFSAAVLATPLFLSAAPAPMTPVDMVELPRLSEPRLSPDGRYVLYLRSTTDWQANEIVDRFRLLDARTGEALPVPEPSEPEESFGEAWWSPDGECFATRLRRESDRFRQLYLYCLDSREFERITEHESSISSVVWSSDPDILYFVAPRQRDERTEGLLDDDWLIEPYDHRQPREVWRLDLETGAAQPLIAGDFSVRSATLAGDGRRLVYVGSPDHDRDSVHQGDVWVFDPETGQRLRWTENDYRETRPALSPDGNALAYIATVNENREPYYEDKVFVHRRNADRPERLLPDSAMEALSFAWDSAGDGIFILGNTGLRTDLYHYTLATGELRRLTAGDHVLDDWSYDAGLDSHIGRLVSAADPGNVAVMTSESGGFVDVFDEYGSWREQFLLPRQEAVNWRGRDGTEVEGLLVYPLDYQPGGRYPLVTVIHGGPRSSSQFGSWNASRYVAVLAAQGYAVLLPNHRGGTGYGDRFMRDMFGAYFRNAHHDVLAGVDAMIERGIGDPDRLIVFGWSAGGHMVNRLITETGRFKAASSGAGAADWVSMHGESDIRHYRQFWFGGAFPWTQGASYQQYRLDSPLKDAWKVTTPTLFFVGEDDIRVPPTQAIMMYRGVRAAGAETRLFIADGQPHNFERPSFRLFKINTELEWFSRHALGESHTFLLPPEATVSGEANR